jgi:hypothetical protein
MMFRRFFPIFMERQMPKALSKIEHGVMRDGVNSILVFNIGDEVKGVSDDLIKQWQDGGAVDVSEAKTEVKKPLDPKA